MNTNLRSEIKQVYSSANRARGMEYLSDFRKTARFIFTITLFSLSNDSDRLLIHTNSLPTSPQILDPFP